MTVKRALVRDRMPRGAAQRRLTLPQVPTGKRRTTAHLCNQHNALWWILGTGHLRRGISPSKLVLSTTAGLRMNLLQPPVAELTLFSTSGYDRFFVC